MLQSMTMRRHCFMTGKSMFLVMRVYLSNILFVYQYPAST